VTLSNYQFQYNGLVFGGSTPYVVTSVDGLADLPELRVQDTGRGYNDGAFTGRDFLNGRTMTFTMNIFAGGGKSAQQNWATLQVALTPVQQLNSTNGLLQFQLSQTDSAKRMTARVRTRVASISPEYTYGFITAQVTFYAPDPRYYDETATSGTITPTLATGRVYNRTYNLTYTQAVTGAGASTFAVANTGSAPTSPTVVITGPINNPQITDLTSGNYLQINGNLSSSDTVTLDMTNNIVLLNGGAARNLLAGGSQWITVPSGTTHNLFLSAASATGSATVTYRNAWI
jgi:hypothetical protein